VIDSRTMSFGPSDANHPDAVAYRRATDAFRRGDRKTFEDTIDEDVAWHFSGRSWLAREIRGRQNLLAYFDEITRRTSGTFVLEDRAISANDHHVLARQRLGAIFNDDLRMFDCVSVIRFVGGRQAERWLHLIDPEGADAFFGRFA